MVESITWLQMTILHSKVSFKVLQFPIIFKVKNLIYIKSIHIQRKWGAKKSPFKKHFQLWPTNYTSLCKTSSS